MEYSEYKVEDFLYDEFFVSWVKNPGPESSHFWESWIKNHPEKITLINQAREIITSIGYKNLHTPTDHDYNMVLGKILSQNTSWSQVDQLNNRKTAINWLRYAAAFAFLAATTALALYLDSDRLKSESAPIVNMIHKESPLGQKLTFELSDGTRVKLNAGSSLSYPDSFTGNEREVYLEGEAFFEVKRDESMPFIVKTDELLTTVLGTSFNVEAYKDGSSSVAVLTGKVKVNKSKESEAGDTYYLTENQMITISSETKSITKTDLETSDIFSWKDNVIEFNKTDFNQIVKRLERWYGVQFTIEKEGQFEGLFTGRYNDEPLDLVLEGLKDEYNFQFTIVNKNVRIF